VQQDMLVTMAKFIFPGTFGQIYGLLIGLIYGLLLIFAGNTALIDITNVTYALARDNELPKQFTILNDKYGVPIWGLITAGVAPILTVIFVGAKVEALAALYAIGVVGAVTLNLAGTALQVKGKERYISGFGAALMGILFITLALTKMEATFFAAGVLVVGLSARALQKRLLHKQVALIESKREHLELAKTTDILVPVYDEFDYSLFRFIINYATGKTVNKKVTVLYIRKEDSIQGNPPKTINEDVDAYKFLTEAKNILEKAGIATTTLYHFAESIGYTINEYRTFLKPELTILSPHSKNLALDFLGGSTVESVLTNKTGEVLIHTGTNWEKND